MYVCVIEMSDFFSAWLPDYDIIIIKDFQHDAKGPSSSISMIIKILNNEGPRSGSHFTHHKISLNF